MYRVSNLAAASIAGLLAMLGLSSCNSASSESGSSASADSSTPSSARAGSGAVGDPRRSAANFGLNTAGIETDTNSIREKLSTGHD